MSSGRNGAVAAVADSDDAIPEVRILPRYSRESTPEAKRHHRHQRRGSATVSVVTSSPVSTMPHNGTRRRPTPDGGNSSFRFETGDHDDDERNSPSGRLMVSSSPSSSIGERSALLVVSGRHSSNTASKSYMTMTSTLSYADARPATSGRLSGAGSVIDVSGRQRLRSPDVERARGYSSSGGGGASTVVVVRCSSADGTKTRLDSPATYDDRELPKQLVGTSGVGRSSGVCERPGSAALESTDVRPSRARRCLGCCKSFIAFLFSTIGLTCLLVGYTIIGGFIFQALEAPHERKLNREVVANRNYHIELLWNATEELNVLHPYNWTLAAVRIFDTYAEYIFNVTKHGGWDGHDDLDGGTDEGGAESQWSFAGALLYSITVITTIGYGHIAPKTRAGKVVTMLYAIFGIPLSLLTITNLGGFMATAFRWFYKNVICGVCCCTYCCPTTSGHRRKTATAAPAGKRRAAGDGKGGGDGGGKVTKDCSVDSALAAGHGQVPEVQWRTGLRRTLHTDGDYSSVHVPIYVSMLLMLAYVALGALLFSLIEGWDYLIGSYFCFITLSTIGFGDYVPGSTLAASDSQGKMVLCALYLLFGLSLLAMCFDLMQEEVRRKFRALGTKLGLFDKQQMNVNGV